jgi:hypothetical protein
MQRRWRERDTNVVDVVVAAGVRIGREKHREGDGESEGDRQRESEGE